MAILFGFIANSFLNKCWDNTYKPNEELPSCEIELI